MIQRTTTIHCDLCGHWEHAGAGMGNSARNRRRRGWRKRVPPNGGPLLDVCPKCERTGQ